MSRLKIGAGDITKVKDVQVIVNAANGIGIMGAGLAGALARSGGEMLSKAARDYGREHGPIEEGNFYITDAGLLKRRGVKQIYHAVTMRFPGRPSTIEIVCRALRTVLAHAVMNGIRSIAIPGLGTGIGGLDKKQVAQRMAPIIESYRGQLDIYVIDMNSEFIDAFKKTIKSEIEEWHNT